jgi:hypothetical protein
MQIEIIRSITELAHLESEWNDLLKSSASHVPFLRYEFLTTWWQTLGGGEWEHGDLYIICGRDENGSLRGIAPFFLTDNLEGESALMLVGSIEISDYLDFIVPPEDLAQFTSLVFEHLASVTAPTRYAAGNTARNACNTLHTSLYPAIGKPIWRTSTRNNATKSAGKSVAWKKPR